MAHRVRTTAAAIVAVTLLAACSTSVAGRAVRASGSPGAAPSATITRPGDHARDLLLKSGADTPFGPATAIPLGDNYFTSAQPPECDAAVLLANSPLLPPGAADRAESGYRFNGPQTYGESIGIYHDALDDHHIIVWGFIALLKCFVPNHRGVAGVTRDGTSWPLQIDGVDHSAQALVWTVTQPGRVCGFGLGSAPKVVLLVSACDTQPAFPMEDWVYKRLGQITGHPN